MNVTPMTKRAALTTSLLIMTVVLAGCGEQFIVLDPKGPIGQSQKELMIISAILCAIIIIPVLIIAAVIVWRYRDRPDRKAPYQPEWAHSTKLEIIWWSVPILIIAVLAVVTIKYTYALEPSKPIESEKEPLTIQVTSLDWKWLFKYPEQGIATVNYVQFPEDVPVRFELTSDAPMNSFWIPQLGGQIYTMSGMAMTLYLQADERGQYYGSGANFSGKDFGSMQFEVQVSTEAQFESWVQHVKDNSSALTLGGYDALQKPGVSEQQYFSSFPANLFDQIVNKYAAEDGSGTHAGHSSSKVKPAPAKENDISSTDVADTRHHHSDTDPDADSTSHAGH